MSSGSVPGHAQRPPVCSATVKFCRSLHHGGLDTQHTFTHTNTHSQQHTNTLTHTRINKQTNTHTGLLSDSMDYQPMSKSPAALPLTRSLTTRGVYECVWWRDGGGSGWVESVWWQSEATASFLLPFLLTWRCGAPTTHAPSWMLMRPWVGVFFFLFLFLSLFIVCFSVFLRRWFYLFLSVVTKLRLHWWRGTRRAMS